MGHAISEAWASISQFLKDSDVVPLSYDQFSLSAYHIGHYTGISECQLLVSSKFVNYFFKHLLSSKSRRNIFHTNMYLKAITGIKISI